MFSKRSISMFFLSLIVVFSFVLVGTDAFARQTTISTSSLMITNSNGQVGECIVANLGTKDITVNIAVVSQSAGRQSLGSFTLSPDKIFDVRLNLAPGFFLCTFSYSGNGAVVRANARVADITDEEIFGLTIQRSEAR